MCPEIPAEDRTADSLARWGNLSLERRLADRIAAILFAADEIRNTIALAGSPSNTVPIESAAVQIQDLLRPLLARLEGEAL